MSLFNTLFLLPRNLRHSSSFKVWAKGVCIWLLGTQLFACQHTSIAFTPVQPPTLANYDTPSNLPRVATISLNQATAFIEPDIDEASLPYQIHLLAKAPNVPLTPRLSLSAVSPNLPFENPDILQAAFQEKAHSLAITSRDTCLETLGIRVTLHSITLSITCPAPLNQLFNTLVQFWRPDAFKPQTDASVDIDNIRRQLKLNKHLNSFSGAEIDRIWREKLLGPNHPYNSTLNNTKLYDGLSHPLLQQLQQRAFEQAKWHLFLPHNSVDQGEFDPKLSLKDWPSIETHSKNLTDVQKYPLPTQLQTLYIIDAPGSVQTQVRIGYAFDDSALAKIDRPVACNSLAALLGRSFSGRLYYDLREIRGLTYGVNASCLDTPQSTSIKFYGSTAIEHTGAFVVGILDHLTLVQNHAISDGELNALKTYLIGEKRLEQDTPGLRESQYLQTTLGKGDSDNSALVMRLQTLTPLQLKQFANLGFAGQPLIVLRGDRDKITADLKAKLPEWRLEEVNP
ncbi:insulinase family protein [Shewanella sp. A25]|nr:insulinase family protein [Shewanella shenzhenensis]